MSSLSLVLSKYLGVLYSPFFLWWWEMIKGHHDETKCVEGWMAHMLSWSIRLLWPSNSFSERGSSASRPWGPELGESKTMDKWGLLYFPWPHDSPVWGVRVPSWLFQSPFEDHSQNWFRNWFQSQWSDPNFSAMTSWQSVSPGKRYYIPPKPLQAQKNFPTFVQNLYPGKLLLTFKDLQETQHSR